MSTINETEERIDLSKITMEEILDSRHKAGKAWVNACALHQRYEKGEDEKLKQIMSNIAKTQTPPYGKKSWNRDDLRDAAQSSTEWTTYLDEWNNLYKTMLEAINKRDSWNATLEAKRTQMVNERESRR